MKFDFEKLIEKYGSRKALIVIAGVWAVTQIPIPTNTEEMYFAIAQVAGIAMLGIAGVFCQYQIDNADAPITP
jgi:hypothetical protein